MPVLQFEKPNRESVGPHLAVLRIRLTPSQKNAWNFNEGPTGTALARRVPGEVRQENKQAG